MMIDMPVANAIGYRVEAELAFYIGGVSGRRRQHRFFGQLPLVEVKQAQIKVEMWFGVLHLWGDSSQRLSSLLLLARAHQGDVEPVRAIDQAVVRFREIARAAERSCRRIEVA